MRVLKLGLVQGVFGGILGWLFGFALVIGGRLLPFLEHPYIYHAPA